MGSSRKVPCRRQHLIIMDERLLRILKKVYNKKEYIKDEKGYYVQVKTSDIYDPETATTKYAADNLSAKELVYLNNSNYPLNEIVEYTHDENLQKLKDIIKHPNLSLENLLNAYVAGFGSFPRGRQPVLSYLFAKQVPVHSFSNLHNGENCEICGLQKKFFLEKGNEIFRRYMGYSWNEIVSGFHIDLLEFSTLEPVVPTKEDWCIFNKVINLIEDAAKEETVSKLEQRIKSSKSVPNCEKYRLRGQLITLAELGVLPNQYIKPLFEEFTQRSTLHEIYDKIPSNPHSDVVLPLLGWRGCNGICKERFNELFGSIMPLKMI